MKKLLSVLLCLSLLLALCACGKSKPAGETPAPTPTQTPAPVVPTPPQPATGSDLEPQLLPASSTDLEPAPVPASSSDLEPVSDAPYPLIVPIGERVDVDLDLDGTEETVLVDVKDDADGIPRVVLTVDGVDCTDALYGDDAVQLDDPDPFFYAITDLYDGDPCLEIAVQDWGMSDDYYTNFFRYYKDWGVYGIGGVPGIIRSAWGPGDITFDADGNIFTQERMQVLQTWFCDVVYVLNNAERLQLDPQDMYEASRPSDVTLKTALLAYDGRGGESFPIDAGVEMSVRATDNREWIYCVSESEDWALWFHLNPDNGFEIETPDGYLPVWDALDGLLFAD